MLIQSSTFSKTPIDSIYLLYFSNVSLFVVISHYFLYTVSTKLYHLLDIVFVTLNALSDFSPNEIQHQLPLGHSYLCTATKLLECIARGYNKLLQFFSKVIKGERQAFGMTIYVYNVSRYYKSNRLTPT